MFMLKIMKFMVLWVLMKNIIEGIFINSEAQSRGLGKSLLDFVKEKKERLHLNVYQKNTRAINFYKKEGFKIESTTIDEITKEKEYFMVWERI